MKTIWVCLILLCACAKSESASSTGLFSSELSNYNFTRFENDEVICYKYGPKPGEGSISCKWKE